MPKTAHEDILIVKSAKNTNNSKQTDKEVSALGGIAPPANPSLLIRTFQRSFVIGGVAEKIATTSASGWIFDESVSDQTRQIIESIDLEELFLSYFVTGNAYFEKIRNGFGQLVSLERFLPDKVRIRWNNEAKTREYLYFNNGKKAEFSAEDIVHCKTTSIQSKHYGESKLGKCVDQIALLAFIDQYYSGVFENGFFNNKILADKHGKLTNEQKEVIRTSLNDRAKGLANAFSLMILPVDLDTVNLDDINNVEKFLVYREDLIQSIAVALNIPVDVILPQKASRATKGVSLSELNTDIIWPMQQRVLKQIKQSLRADLPDIEGVSILAIDTKNQLDEMKIQTGYVSAGIYTANEVREANGKDAHIDGDELRVSASPSLKPSPELQDDLDTVEKTVQKLYKHYYEA